MYDVLTQRTMEAVQEGCRKIPEVTLRDLFAMNALNGILASPTFSGTPDQLASYAYEYADAMTAARKIKK